MAIQRPVVIPVIIRDGRHPLVVTIMVACVLSGVLGLIRPSSPQLVIDRFVPAPWRGTYYLLLGVAGLIALVGVWLPDLRDRLIWERIGLWFFSGAVLIYPLAIYTVSLGSVGFGGMISCLLGVGGIWRMITLTRQLRRWRRDTAATGS